MEGEASIVSKFIHLRISIPKGIRHRHGREDQRP